MRRWSGSSSPPGPPARIRTRTRTRACCLASTAERWWQNSGWRVRTTRKHNRPEEVQASSPPEPLLPSARRQPTIAGRRTTRTAVPGGAAPSAVRQRPLRSSRGTQSRCLCLSGRRDFTAAPAASPPPPSSGEQNPDEIQQQPVQQLTGSGKRKGLPGEDAPVTGAEWVGRGGERGGRFNPPVPADKEQCGCGVRSHARARTQ